MIEVILRLILIGISSILGLIAVPIALLFAKDGKLPKWAWIWDNDRDGIDGDGGFKNEHCPSYGLAYGSFLCRYIWLAIRNPSANLCWHLGVKEPIIELYQKGNWSTAVGESGKEYDLYHVKNKYIEFYIGYKNDNAIVGEYVPYNIGIAFRINWRALWS